MSAVINGVNLNQFKRVENVSHIRQKYRAEGKFVCSYLGTVGMAHGLEVVLKAAEAARDANNNEIVLWIVGDGASRQDLEKQARQKGLDNVIFTGRLPKENMPEMISASDACLVHLKGTELFQTVIPSKIFEYMAMDAPIIMGVKGEALDIVIKGNAGVEMQPDSVESLLECIRIIRERGREAFQGRDYVAQHFDRDHLANGMLAILESYSKK